MTLNPDTATLTELRDYLAECQGWKQCKSDDEHGEWWAKTTPVSETHVRIDGVRYGHPVPESLDAIARCLPEGKWNVRVYINEHGLTICKIFHDDAVFETVADTELLARARAACKAWMMVLSSK